MNELLFPFRKAVQRALLRAGYSIHRITPDERRLLDEIERQKHGQSLQSVFGNELPRLIELRRRYAEVRLPVALHSVWGSGKESGARTSIGWGGIDLRTFRGHNAYVWDYAGSNIQVGRLRYHLYAESLRTRDPAGLLSQLEEDGAFGCFTYDHPSVGRVSRDLLDSVLELNFLQRHLQFLQRSDLRVLDVGAGYGRMAYRSLEANPGIASYTCVDAVPESTFLCEFYLRHRGLSQRVEVIALDELDTRLRGRRFDLAFNIHSFSECTYAAIEWWLRRLCALEIRHLLIVPNDPTRFLSTESDRSNRDYAPLLGDLGFRQVACEPVFAEPTVRELMGVRDQMFLFERAQVSPT
ncbi:MAG: putative sugar O-methyltransferase [Panacagrimonas sp.]